MRKKSSIQKESSPHRRRGRGLGRPAGGLDARGPEGGGREVLEGARRPDDGSRRRGAEGTETGGRGGEGVRSCSFLGAGSGATECSSIKQTSGEWFSIPMRGDVLNSKKIANYLHRDSE